MTGSHSDDHADAVADRVEARLSPAPPFAIPQTERVLVFSVMLHVQGPF